MRRPGTSLLFAALLTLLGGAASADTLRVFAAASLTDAFREIASAYEKAHPGDSVELNFAGSQVLQTQIEQGAPADVFASADLDHANALRAAGLLGAFRVFARNKLVVVVPSGAGSVDRLQDLVKPGVRIVVAGAGVPAGQYTVRVLGLLAKSGLYGDDFAARVQASVVSQETNVRAVLAKVALGEADAGFVYVTDAAGSDKVRSIEIPDAHNVVAEYPIGVVSKSGLAAKAQAFVDFVMGPDGQALLAKRGFAH